MRLSKPIVWIIAVIFLPIGLLLAFTLPMSATSAQRVVWMSTGWFVLVWIATLLIRVLRSNNPADETAPSPETVQEGKSHG